MTAFIIVLLPSAASLMWQRYRAPSAEWISSEPPEDLPAAAPPGPIYFGPAWPPTDADWSTAFASSRSRWIYPLPGPLRRPGTADDRIFGPAAPREFPAVCRLGGHCGVDLGGDLWGEHVYAAHDGVVDRVQSSGNDEHGGQYVRLSHFGGMVFTQYFHLAAVPGGLARGVHVRAGDVIGLLGDTGLGGGHRHLHFTLSVRPSAGFSEAYWDPRPLMAGWPLRQPARGTVAGLASLGKSEMPRLRRGK